MKTFSSVAVRSGGMRPCVRVRGEKGREKRKDEVVRESERGERP
jgi:methylphosphotriester-DNA--protein-cysteine methyltransferase